MDMRMTRRQAIALSVALPRIWSLPLQLPQPKRLRRSDSYFGMHFDLHPHAGDPALGRDVSEEMVAQFLEQVKPDYVQYDCKGHVGYLGYPSQVGPSAPVVNDSLAIWRKVTAERGVALYIHFSGVWDSRAVADHPEWARVRPDGQKEENQTSTFGPYVDQRMIPQLKEAAEKYDLDGAWVDGECWATNPDYGANVAEAFFKVTGIQPLPKKPGDWGWLEFLEFNREQFRKYVRHYIDELHRVRPGFQVASNWLYSTFVPERPELPVDFLSGDYLGNASISMARLEARYLGSTGKPWDLMAWGFQSARNSPVGAIHKPAAQLKQEASVVLAQGGGFQIYYQPTRAGWLAPRHIGVMAEVAAFCRARQAVSHKSETVPEAGVLYSKNTLYSTAGKLFGGWGAHDAPARGLLDALLECHYSVDVIPDWKLFEAASRYRLIVVPEWSAIGDDVNQTLVSYLAGGGRLLLCGAINAARFAGVLGIKTAGPAGDAYAWVPGDEVFANVRGVWQDVEPAGLEVIEQRFPTYDASREGRVAATLHRHGSGQAVVFYGPLGSVFAATHAPETRRLAGRLARRLYTPIVEVEAPPTVEVALRRKGSHRMLHLVNTTGMQVAQDYSAVDFVPPVGPVRLRIQMARPPSRVVQEPGGVPVDGQWSDGTWSGLLARLEVHQALVWDE